MPSEAGDGSVKAHLAPTRPELKGFGDWDTVRGSAIDMGAVGSACEQFQSMNEYRVAGSFRLDKEQGDFELQMMGFRWFRAGVRAGDRKRCHTILQKELADRPIQVRRHAVRIFTEIAHDMKPVSQSQAIWLGTMAKFGLGMDLVDIRWLTNCLSVSVEGTQRANVVLERVCGGTPAGERVKLVLFATHSPDSKWWTDETDLRTLTADIDVQYVTTDLEEV